MIKKLFNIFYNKNFVVFLIIGVVNTFNGVLFAAILSNYMNTNTAFIVGYILSLSISYLLNSYFNFKQTLSLNKYLKFCLSYLPNFVIQNILVLVLFNILGINKIIVFALSALIGVPITFIFIKVLVFIDKSKFQ